MNPLSKKLLVACVAVCALSMLPAQVWAQGRGFRPFRTLPAFVLAQLEEVQKDLKLSDEQKQKVTSINEEMNTKSREAFQNASGDFAKMFADIQKLSNEQNAKFNETLDESQRNRALEIFVQVAEVNALADEGVGKALGLSGEQRAKIKQAGDDYNASAREAFQSGQDLSQDERREKFQQMRETRDRAFMAALTAAQKEQFEKLKGEKIDIDLSKLPGFGRRGGQNN